MKKLIIALWAFLLSGMVFAGAYEDMEEAMTRRDSAAVIQLLNRGMDVNTVNRTGDTLLIQAVRSDMPELVDALLQRRARLNFRNRNGETALSIAAFIGNMAYVQRIVESGAEVDFYGWPPITYAAFNGHAEIVEYLIKKGADINTKTENGSTALYLAARNGHVAVVKLLLGHEADPKIANQNDETAVDAAIKGNHTEILDLLRAAGGRSGKSLSIDLSK